MRSVLAATAIGFALLSATASSAGPYADDLTKCIVKSASPDDQLTFVKFMFSAMAAHPAVKQYANLDAKAQADFSEATNAVFQRLLTVDCRAETVAALKYEGSSALTSAFSTLGQVAMRSLMSDPAVTAIFDAFGQKGNPAALAEVYKEAGLPPPR